MTLGGYLTLLASAVGVGALSANQDPTFESPTYSPLIPPDAQVTTGGVFGTSVSSVQIPQKRVSVSFDNASVREVVTWLTKQGVSFMTTDSELPSDRRITLNVTDQPLQDVVHAVAGALGGHWESQGKILVFHRGSANNMIWQGGQGMLSEKARDPFNSKEFHALPQGSKGLMDEKAWAEYNKALSKKFGQGGNFNWTPGKVDFKWDDKEMQKLSESQRKEIDKAMREAQRSLDEARKAGAFDHAKLTEQQMREIQKSMEEARKSGAFDKAKMTDKQLQEMRKEMESMTKLSERQREEVRRSIEEARKSGAFDKAKMSQKDMEELQRSLNKQFNSDDWRKSMIDAKEAAKMSKELQQKLMKDKDLFRGAEGMKGFDGFKSFGGQDLQTLVRSLTPDQLEKHRRQGYLNYSDLTPLQQKHLGRMGKDGNWTIQYRGDGRDVTIKSNDK